MRGALSPRGLLAFLALLTLAAPAAATEYFVAPGGNDSAAGTKTKPFATFQKGLATVHNGDTLTIRAGTYRLIDGGKQPALHRPGATPGNHVTLRAYPGEKVIFLGSRSTQGMTWEAASGGLSRLDAGFLTRDPTGLFTAAGVRIEHVMKTVGGTRSHADITDLKNPGEWTKADAGGAGCQTANAGCYIYLKPPKGMDPNAQLFELSQRNLMHVIGTSYLEVRGLETLYTQATSINLEGGKDQLIEDNVFGHNSNGNDNSYSIFISYGGGVTVRNNRAFDSKYWGGFSNSKGITLMDMDPANPSLVEGNEVYDIVGQGITIKEGVANLVVRGNYVHDVGVGVETSSRRCHWKKPNCATTDPENYPGGGWTIQENALVRCGVGVRFSYGEQNENNRVFNNVFYDCDSGVDVVLAHPGTLIANNLFVKNTRGVFLDHGAGGTKKTFQDYLPVFSAHNNGFFQNQHDYLLRPDWTGPGGSGTGFTLADVQSAHSIEKGSLAGDPLFVNPAQADFHLAGSSPAKGTGDGSLYGRPSVDMGRYPLDGSPGGAGGASGAGASGSSPSGTAAGCGCRMASGTRRASFPWFTLLGVLAIGARRRWYAARRGRVE